MLEPQVPQVITLADAQVDDPRLADIRQLNHPRLRPDRQPRLELDSSGDYIPASRPSVILADGALPIARMCGTDSAVAPAAIFGRTEKLQKFATDYPEQWSRIAQLGIPVYELPAALLRDVVGFELHRGLLAVALRPDSVELGTKSAEEVLAPARTIVVLEGVGDPDNIGAIYRSAASLGADALVFGAGCGDLWDRRVIRVSMGQALRVPSIRIPGGFSNWHHGLADLRNQGFYVTALSPGAQAVQLRDALVGPSGNRREKVALLLGAEGPGLTPHAMNAADACAVIPMAAGADSLNVAVTAACCLYERWRG